VRCPNCGILLEALPSPVGNEHLSLAHIVTLTTWAKLLQIDTVDKLFDVSCNTIAAAVSAAIKDGFSRRDLGTIVHIGIDKISLLKGHTYMTQVYELDTNCL
jgi:hypothetical protein